jgi:NADPH:quinone reductase-like Zn-dependent oxidoreductase
MSYASGPGFGADLATLAGLVAHGRLRVDIGLDVAWTDLPTAIEALRERRVAGKAVLRVESG